MYQGWLQALCELCIRVGYKHCELCIRVGYKHCVSCVVRPGEYNHLGLTLGIFRAYSLVPRPSERGKERWPGYETSVHVDHVRLSYTN